MDDRVGPVCLCSLSLSSSTKTCHQSNLCSLPTCWVVFFSRFFSTQGSQQNHKKQQGNRPREDSRTGPSQPTLLDVALELGVPEEPQLDAPGELQRRPRPVEEQGALAEQPWRRHGVQRRFRRFVLLPASARLPRGLQWFGPGVLFLFVTSAVRTFCVIHAIIEVL